MLRLMPAHCFLLRCRDLIISHVYAFQIIPKSSFMEISAMVSGPESLIALDPLAELRGCPSVQDALVRALIKFIAHNA